MVSLATQCSIGVQFNLAAYLCKEFMVDCREVHEEEKMFHDAW